MGCGFVEEAEKTMKGKIDDASRTEALSEATPERTSTLSAELTHSNQPVWKAVSYRGLFIAG